MHYPEILRVLTQEPIAMTPTAHASWLSRFQAFLEWRAVDREPGRGPSGELVQRESASVANGVMTIPVKGPIGRGLGPIEKGAGCVDYSEIMADLDEMMADPRVTGGIINWDSPGGMVQGGLALENKLSQRTKPVYSYSEGMLCSQAYRMACHTDGIYTTGDSDVGCIGVYCYMLDESKRYADAGVKPVLIASGKYKGMGAPGLSLTQEQMDLLKHRVDHMAEDFKMMVEKMRKKVMREDMEGQSFMGMEAMQKGFVDGTVNDISEVLALL